MEMEKESYRENKNEKKVGKKVRQKKREQGRYINRSKYIRWLGVSLNKCFLL